MKRKNDAVVPSVQLNRMVKNWNRSGAGGAKAPEKTSEAWLQLCKFVRDNKVSRAQLHWALVKVRGMKESSAGVVASRLLKFQRSEEASAMLDRALAGEDITIRDLRGVALLDRDPEDVVRTRLRGAARAATKASMRHDTFAREARDAYALAKRLARVRKAPEAIVDDA